MVYRAFNLRPAFFQLIAYHVQPCYFELRHTAAPFPVLPARSSVQSRNRKFPKDQGCSRNAGKSYNTLPLSPFTLNNARCFLPPLRPSRWEGNRLKGINLAPDPLCTFPQPSLWKSASRLDRFSFPVAALFLSLTLHPVKVKRLRRASQP